MNSEADDYYSILGASEGETREQIERRYRRLAHRHHPDCGGDEESMKSLNEAWAVLRDERSREDYDARRAREQDACEAHEPVSSQPAGADALFGRVVGATLCILLGLTLVFAVRFHYVVFLWPLALLGGFVVLLGVMMARVAFKQLKEESGRRSVAADWAGEAVFWSCLLVGAYGVYWVLTEV